MCLLIPLRKEHRRSGSLAEVIYQQYVSVAEADIVVFKILQKVSGGFVSPYKGAPYKLGDRYTANFTFDEHATSHIGYTRLQDNLIIHQGLHSYATFDAADKDITGECGDVVCKFTIPKGSLVFKQGDEICSNAYRFDKVLVNESV